MFDNFFNQVQLLFWNCAQSFLVSKNIRVEYEAQSTYKLRQNKLNSCIVYWFIFDIFQKNITSKNHVLLPIFKFVVSTRVVYKDLEDIVYLERANRKKAH